jgi:hypothetical protein
MPLLIENTSLNVGLPTDATGPRNEIVLEYCRKSNCNTLQNLLATELSPWLTVIIQFHKFGAKLESTKPQVQSQATVACFSFFSPLRSTTVYCLLDVKATDLIYLSLVPLLHMVVFLKAAHLSPPTISLFPGFSSKTLGTLGTI